MSEHQVIHFNKCKNVPSPYWLLYMELSYNNHGHSRWAREFSHASDTDKLWCSVADHYKDKIKV